MLGNVHSVCTEFDALDPRLRIPDTHHFKPGGNKSGPLSPVESYPENCPPCPGPQIRQHQPPGCVPGGTVRTPRYSASYGFNAAPFNAGTEDRVATRLCGETAVTSGRRDCQRNGLSETENHSAPIHSVCPAIRTTTSTSLGPSVVSTRRGSPRWITSGDQVTFSVCRNGRTAARPRSGATG